MSHTIYNAKNRAGSQIKTVHRFVYWFLFVIRILPPHFHAVRLQKLDHIVDVELLLFEFTDV